MPDTPNYKPSTLVQFYLSHRYCALAATYGLYTDSILSTRLLPTFGKNSNLVGVEFIVNRQVFDRFADTIDAEENLKLIDADFDGREYGTREAVFHVLARDPIFNVLRNASRGPNSRIIVPKYELSKGEVPHMGYPMEYMELIVPNRDIFFSRILPGLKNIENRRYLDWRVAEFSSRNKRRVPGISLREQYILERALETDYFDTQDKKGLEAIAEELDDGTTTLGVAKEADEIAERVFTEFFLSAFAEKKGKLPPHWVPKPKKEEP